MILRQWQQAFQSGEFNCTALRFINPPDQSFTISTGNGNRKKHQTVWNQLELAIRITIIYVLTNCISYAVDTHTYTRLESVPQIHTYVLLLAAWHLNYSKCIYASSELSTSRAADAPLMIRHRLDSSATAAMIYECTIGRTKV